MFLPPHFTVSKRFRSVLLLWPDDALAKPRPDPWTAQPAHLNEVVVCAVDCASSDSVSTDALRVHQAGSVIHPRVRWTREQFCAAWLSHAHAAKESGAEASPSETLSDEALSDEYLRLACLARAPGALETLETVFLVPLGQWLAKRCGDGVLADEALQALRQKLLIDSPPRLSAYRSTGHLTAWLRVVALRIGQDLARARGAQWLHGARLAEHFLPPANDADARLVQAEVDELFVATLRDVVRALPDKERYALRMHLLAGWNVGQIGEALEIHRATAARWIVAAKERINHEVRQRLAAKLELGPLEIERVFSLLSTQLDVHLSQIFLTEPALSPQAPSP